MTEINAKYKIEQAGGKWEDFIYWMRGQTLGLYANGDTDFYEDDVERFIRNKCNKNTKIID